MTDDWTFDDADRRLIAHMKNQTMTRSEILVSIDIHEKAIAQSEAALRQHARNVALREALLDDLKERLR